MGDRRPTLRCRPWGVLRDVPAEKRMRSNPCFDLRRCSVTDRASREVCSAALHNQHFLESDRTILPVLSRHVAIREAGYVREVRGVMIW